MNEYKELLDLFSDLIKFDTSNPPGNEFLIVDYLENIFRKNHIEYHIYSNQTGRLNILAKLAKAEKFAKQNNKPIILLSHIDVVPADTGWTKPAFSALYEAGKIYGRGTIDTKQLTAMQLSAFLMIHRRKTELDRDLYFLATADEEKGSIHGMQYLAEILPPEILEADVISEGGGFVIPLAAKQFRTIACAEKGVCHGLLKFSCSNPEEYFAMIRQIIQRISRQNFPEYMNEVNQCFISKTNALMAENSTLRNLKEYTLKENLVIQAFDMQNWQEHGEISFSYRFMPHKSKQEVEEFIRQLFADLPIETEISFSHMGYISKLNNELYKVLADVSAEYDPKTEILPIFALGNTDGRFFQGNVYGYSPMLEDVPFAEVLKMVHQADEYITEKSLIFGHQVILETLLKIIE